MSERIYLSPPHMSGDELELVKKAFESNWIAPVGPDINNFEKEISEYIGQAETCVLSSGTAAIHLALRSLNLEKDDVVICQSLTFAGSANPIIYENCRPVFIDSEPETWNMSPEYLEDAIRASLKKGKKPRAIIYVHIYGMPAQIDEIRNLANKYDVFLIEDAAEALGSSYKGERVGKFGDISVLSFNGNKIITTSGGGALLSKDENIIARTKFLATQAREDQVHYEHKVIGFNYRMSNVCAAIGRGQLLHIEDRVKRKREIHQTYLDLLGKYDVFEFLQEPHGFRSNRWLTCVIVKNENIRTKIFNILNQNNIESRPIWKPMHLQPVFKGEKFFGGQFSEDLFKKGLCLPSGTNLKKDDLIRICELITSVI